jgi:hypothetical protein
MQEYYHTSMLAGDSCLIWKLSAKSCQILLREGAKMSDEKRLEMLVESYGPDGLEYLRPINDKQKGSKSRD